MKWLTCLKKDWLDPGIGGVDGGTIPVIVIVWVASDATSIVSVWKE